MLMALYSAKVLSKHNDLRYPKYHLVCAKDITDAKKKIMTHYSFHLGICTLADFDTYFGIVEVEELTPQFRTDQLDKYLRNHNSNVSTIG